LITAGKITKNAHDICLKARLTSDIALFYPKRLMVVYNIRDGDYEVHKCCGHQSLWSDLPVEITAIRWISVTWRHRYST